MSLIDFSFEFHKEYPFWMYQAPRRPFVVLLTSEEQAPQGRATSLCGAVCLWSTCPCVHFCPFSGMSRAKGSFCLMLKDPGTTVLRGWGRAQEDLTAISLVVAYVCPSRTKAQVTWAQKTVGL